MQMRTREIVKLAGARADFRDALTAEVRRIAFEKRALRKKQLQKLMEQGGTFGVMSAYQPGSKKQNKDRHGQLVADLQRLGYRPETLRGSWEGVTEQSLLVRDIKPQDLFELGRKYNQDAVIHKSKDGVLGMYHTKGAPRAEIAVDPKGDPAFQSSSAKDLYSKSRGLSFEFGFLWGENLPWDGKQPVTRKQMRTFVQERAQSKPESDSKEQGSFEEEVAGRRFRHPETGNDVLYTSLPSDEQAKIYREWARPAAAG